MVLVIKQQCRVGLCKYQGEKVVDGRIRGELMDE